MKRTTLTRAAIGVALLAACGTDGSAFESGFGSPSATTGGGTNASLAGGSADDAAAPRACTNLCTRQVTCANGGSTSLSGTVKDPAGKVPLYNVLVYVPNAPVAPLTTGASCDRCGTISGEPLVTALTDATGHFKLENVPVGADVPLVVQVGKWRRQVVVPNVAQCNDTALADDTLRLPRNKAEGDLPQMAIASGDADPFECLLTKMGIDEAEFTRDGQNGRVHYFRENGVDTSPAAARASSLWSDLEKLKKYDLVFLPCEGGPHGKPNAAEQNLIDYTSVGGRVFTTHYGYVWLDDPKKPFAASGDWQPEQQDIGDTALLPATINRSFPKGAAFAEWLVNVGASQQSGKLDLIESRHDLNHAKDPPATTWMTTTSFPGPQNGATLHMTFNTPIGVPEDQQCGRVVYSDFHVSATAKTDAKTFPASCKKGDLSAQEKALEFMLFDLSSCIQSDKAPPVAPGGVH